MRRDQDGTHGDEAKIFRNIAVHLRGLAGDIEDIEAAVSELSQSNGLDKTQPVINRLQKLDALCQSLRDLARLNDGLALSGTARTQALSYLQLSATRELLNAVIQVQSTSTRAGAVELF